MRFASVEEALDVGTVFRSLRPSDVAALDGFYNGLGERSRSFWHRDPDGQALAAEHRVAIDRDDKLRLVVIRGA